MAQDSAFLLDFNLVFGYGLIFFTSSVNLIVSVNFSVNFADTFQLILFIDYDIGIDHIERTKSADAAFLGEDPDIVDAVKPEKSNFIVRGIDTLKCQNVIFLKYRLIAVDQNPESRSRCLWEYAFCAPGSSEWYPEKESRNVLCGCRGGKTED